MLVCWRVKLKATDFLLIFDYLMQCDIISSTQVQWSSQHAIVWSGRDDLSLQAYAVMRSFCQKITRGGENHTFVKEKQTRVYYRGCWGWGCITGWCPIDRSKDPIPKPPKLKNWRKRGLSDEAPWGILLKCPRYMHSAKQRVNLYISLHRTGCCWPQWSTMLTTFFVEMISGCSTCCTHLLTIWGWDFGEQHRACDIYWLCQAVSIVKKLKDVRSSWLVLIAKCKA